MKTDSIQLIKDLSNASGISGFEDDVLDVARKYIKDMASVEEDKIRNLYFHRKENTGNGSKYGRELYHRGCGG